MKFDKMISLKKYSDDAIGRFDEMGNRLSTIEGAFETRMKGKSLGSLIFSSIVTIVWLVIFLVAAIVARPMVNNFFLIIAVVAVIAMIAFMLISNYMNYTYYGKFTTYKNTVTGLKDRVSAGKNAIPACDEAFKKAKANGWHLPLKPGPSISAEADTVEATIAGIESLEKGFVSKTKTALFFIVNALITIVGSLALFPVGDSIINGITDVGFSYDTIVIFDIIALVIVLGGHSYLAYLVWEATKYNVTNATLLITLVGPVAFLLLILVATLVVLLVVFLFWVAIAIAGLALAYFCFCGG